MTDLRSFQGELDDLGRRRDASRAEAIAHQAAAARVQGAAAAQEDKLAQQARAATAKLDAKLNQRVRDVLGQLEDEAPFAALDPEVPLALLPVRLETRFRDDELIVRVYPDDIHVEDHEPELTDQEVAAGRRYWETTWRGGPEGSTTADAAELAAWRELAGALGQQRAAWVARTMTPTGGSRPATPPAPDEPLPSPPVFPQPPLRTRAWARPAVAHALPDRWLALAFAGATEIGRAWSKPLPDELPLGPDPAAAPPAKQAGPPVPDELRWTVDLAAAEESGMVVHVPLPAGTSQVDRLVVLGVSGSIDAAGSAARLAGLLDEHHYTDGVAFLPQGTPTNNTAADRSGLASQRPAEATFPIERRPAAVAPESNAAAVAAALGIDAAPLATVEHAADREQDEARAMNTVLWPCTWEYWLEQLAQPELPPGSVDAAERQFLENVRGRGPLPVLRIGRQPYGLLPATSLTRWVSRGEPPADVELIRKLISLRRFWVAGIPSLPLVRQGRGLDEGLLGVLGQEAVSRGVRVRTARGSNFNRMLDIAFDDPEGRRQGHLSQLALAALEIDRQPFLAGFVFSDRSAGLRLPLVAGSIGPDGEREAAAALARLRTAPNQDLLAERAEPASARSLLYLLGRQSALAERVRAGIVLLGQFDPGLAAAVPAVDAEIAADGSDVTGSEMSSTSPTVAVSRRIAARGGALDEQVGGTGAAAGVRVSELVDREVVAVDPAQLGSALADYTRFAGALQTLEGVSRERLELLLGETLDCCSHRLDAWLTSVATRRLADLRRDRPTGIALGAFGVVEDLARRPARPAAVDPPAGVPAGTVTDPLNTGYVHAPSLGQAATAAVLRSAHLSHATGNGDGNTFAVELSSDRVRLALRLLEGIRTGQPLGALLGYRLERELHEGHPGLELDEVIAELRRIAPPPAVNERAADPEALPPRNVCDGLVLQRMGIDPVLAAVTLTGGQQAERKDAVRASLESLAATVDAVADLLLAEGVHQLVAGNPERAAASLATIAAGDHAPPEPEVVRTPRAGHALTHRVIVAGGPSVAAAAGWPAGGARATAEPFLERWCGHLLGDLRRVEVRVLLDQPPAVAPAPVVDTAAAAATGSGAGPAVTWPVELTFTLGKLGLGALDFVYESTTAPGGASGKGTLLEARAIRRARAHAPAGAEAGVPRIDPTRAAAGAPTLAAAVEVARALKALLGAARPARPEDFARPQDGARGTVDTADAGRRAATAVAALDTAVTELAHALDTAAPAASVRARLDALAGFGVGAFQSPAGPAPEADAVALAGAVAEGRRRLDRVKEALTSAADDAGTRELAALAEVFGADFRAVPLATPVGGSRFAASLAKSAALVADDPLAPADWLRRTGRVRPAVGLLDDVLLYSEALASGGPFRLAVAQLPLAAFMHADGTPAPSRWVALPFKDELGPDPVTSVVVHAPPGLDPTKPVAGLVVDEWPEVVPAAELVTGVAFHSDAPGARPPQTILLAVHPDPQQQWSSQILADVVLETLELAKLRLVDLEAVAWAGRFLPALYVPDGDVPGALTLDFKQLVEHWHDKMAQVPGP